MNEASRLHDQTVIELLREDPSFAGEYLSASFNSLCLHHAAAIV